MAPASRGTPPARSPPCTGSSTPNSRTGTDRTSRGTYGQANQAAIEHIARVVAEEGIDCDFRRVSNYTYAESDDALARVRDEAALAARLGLPSVFTSDVPLPFAVRGAVRFDDQAQLHAVKIPSGPRPRRGRERKPRV